MEGLRFEIVKPSPIPNATVAKVYNNSEFIIYQISPNNGFVLHDKEKDKVQTNPATGERYTVVGYTRSSIQCDFNYDFMPKFIDIDGGFVGYGMREIWCKPIG